MRHGSDGNTLCFEQFGIVPDILTVAKRLAAGFLSGIYFKQDHLNFLSHDPARDISPPLVENRFAALRPWQPFSNRRGKNIESGEEKGKLLNGSCPFTDPGNQKDRVMMPLILIPPAGSTELLNTPGRVASLLLVPLPSQQLFALLTLTIYRAGDPDRLRSDLKAIENS